MEKRKNFYLIFKEAVNNVLKYSNCNTLNTENKLHHQRIELKVKDDGDGFEIKKTEAATSKSLSGNGLQNMRMRARNERNLHN